MTLEVQKLCGTRISKVMILHTQIKKKNNKNNTERPFCTQLVKATSECRCTELTALQKLRMRIITN